MLAGGLVTDLVDLEVCGPGIPGPERIPFLVLLAIVGVNRIEYWVVVVRRRKGWRTFSFAKLELIRVIGRSFKWNSRLNSVGRTTSMGNFLSI